jgi:hypothetical protein
MARANKITHFFTKVVGVTHQNSNRKTRQKIIKNCARLEPLVLDHEENNQHDPNAIRVLRRNGEQIGYLDANLAKQIVSQVKQGFGFDAFIVDLTGGEPTKPTRGVNVVIIVAPAGTGPSEIGNYWQRLTASGELEEYAPFEDLRDAREMSGDLQASAASSSPFEQFQDVPKIIETRPKPKKPGCASTVIGCFVLLFLVACLGGCVVGVISIVFPEAAKIK